MHQFDTLLHEFTPKLSPYKKPERDLIREAALWASAMHNKQKRASGEPYLVHLLRVAEILITLNLDYRVIMAALLHDVLEDTAVTRCELRKKFGREVEALVNGVTKISLIHVKSKTVQEAETIRKMLFAMIKDVRVILIKLADKLHNMRTLGFLAAEKRKKIAQECLDIYAPLAGRLGISWIKNELEDLSLKYLQSDIYNQIKQWVAHRRNERTQYLARVEKAIRSEAGKAGIKVELETRAKHFYSIYKKMKRTGSTIDEIYDLLGIRILCHTPSECYELLGLVHKIWLPIEGRFKDYIAMAKSNGYQSLHTTVMGFEGKLIEIQIRTHEMHRTAENGIAAHWLYKKGFSKEIVRPEDIPIINQLKSWEDTHGASREFLEKIKQELLKDSIYVFTPRGEVIELPKGATAIDFAYHIHTEVGNHCMAAKADDTIIPLHRELKNTQVIEIITANNARPHVNWLRYAKTARARSKIRHWLNQNDASLIIDRSIVVKKRLAPAPARKPPKSKQEGTPKQVLDKSKIGIKSGNERNLMIKLARCCNPTIGDAIIGYVSRGRGIIVHRADCPNRIHIKDFGERMIDVEWETVSPKATKRFRVTARFTSDLFSEIEGTLRKYKGHLIEGKLEENINETLNGFFTVELDNKEDFNKVLKNLRTIPAIVNIQPVQVF
ncbi:MAG: bifunctional (p)ppGpp synthetase/guanosine-3',5'-bis(diphosphate) 3'-pyrophosphohydrolase [Spirochaetia bacterium]